MARSAIRFTASALLALRGFPCRGCPAVPAPHFPRCWLRRCCSFSSELARAVKPSVSDRVANIWASFTSRNRRSNAVYAWSGIQEVLRTLPLWIAIVEFAYVLCEAPATRVFCARGLSCREVGYRHHPHRPLARSPFLRTLEWRPVWSAEPPIVLRRNRASSDSR